MFLNSNICFKINVTLYISKWWSTYKFNTLRDVLFSKMNHELIGIINSIEKTSHVFFCRVMPGSGVRTSHNRCSGDSIQYEVCGASSDCNELEESTTSRESQCRKHNSKKVLGRIINNWVPYSRSKTDFLSLVKIWNGEIFLDQKNVVT